MNKLEQARAILATLAVKAPEPATVAAPVNYVSQVLDMPEVDEILIDDQTQEEEVGIIRRLDLVSVFNLTTHDTFQEWVKYPEVVQAAARVAALLPHDHIRKDGVRCANVISTSRKEAAIPLIQVALYTVIWGVCQERTSAQVATLFPCYEAGTVQAEALVTAVDELLYTASQARPAPDKPALATLREAVQDIRGTRWILSNIHKLVEEARELVTYSGLVFNPDAYTIESTQELILPAIKDNAGNVIKKEFTCKAPANSHLSPFYLMPALSPEIQAKMEEAEAEHRRKARKLS